LLLSGVAVRSEAVLGQYPADLSGNRRRVRGLGETDTNPDRSHRIAVEFGVFDTRQAEEVIAQHSDCHISLPSSTPGLLPLGEPPPPLKIRHDVGRINRCVR
jgi:hypothetical protein